VQEREAVKAKHNEQQVPSPVPAEDRLDGEVYGRWPWVERRVWTPRMLETLERGPKNGVWHSLIDKVYAERTLWAAWEKVQSKRGASGVDRQTIGVFARSAEQRIGELARQMRVGRYTPRPVRRVLIPKPGTTQKRPLGIPTVRDRIVQTALRMVIEPIFDRDFATESFGFRPQHSPQQALARVEMLLAEGYIHVVDADLKSYFDTIPHEALLERVKSKVVDGRILSLVESFLNQGVMEEMIGWKPTTVGTPQGGPLSPLLANLYLDALDWKLHLEGWELVRYADDFVVLCRTQEQAREVLEVIRTWCTDAGLVLHPEKTRLVDMSVRGGFDFLGYHFDKKGRWPREKSLLTMENKLHRLTRRNCGENLELLIHEKLNPILNGWFGYFKRSTNSSDFRKLDGYLRARLRSIMRKRCGLRGRSRGRDHQRWPLLYFDKLGLLSLVQLWEEFLSAP
jgi:RNA-directed DNA polymerase